MRSVCRTVTSNAVDRWRVVFEVANAESRLRPLEGIRGLAVLLVFFVHFHSIFSDYVKFGSPVFRISEALGTVGHAGVDLFFSLSGFLIYGAVCRSRYSIVGFLRRRL